VDAIEERVEGEQLRMPNTKFRIVRLTRLACRTVEGSAMRKLGLVVGVVVTALACSSGSDMLNELLDSGVPDADAQTGECPCEAGPQGEPGPQGWPGPQGEPGPSGVVAATSFLGPTHSFLGGNAWTCLFGTQAEEQLDVAEGQRVLITGQGTADPQNYAEIPFEFSVAWRESGDSSNGTLGHFVEDSTVAVLSVSAHVTQLTPPLAAGTYEFGVCMRGTESGRIFAARYLYGTAVVIN
jgi:hypothetical protein